MKISDEQNKCHLNQGSIEMILKMIFWETAKANFYNVLHISQSFLITGACDNKKKAFIGAIKQYKHGVSGDIYACGDDQLVIEKFTYDGLAPDAFFLVGTGSDTPNSNGIILPHPFQGKFYDFEDTKAPILDKAYDGSQRPIVLELPTRIKVSNLKWISVWCRQYEINFGDFVIANDEPTVETISDRG